MLLACLTVDATMTLRDVVDRVADEPDSMYVAIRRFDHGTTYWYTWTVGDLRLAAGRWDPQRVAAPLTVALELHEGGAEARYHTGAPGDLSQAYGVLLRGNEAIGVLRPESTTRGSGTTRSGATRGDGPAAPSGSGPAATREAERRPFAAYPSLQAPERVAPLEAFDLTIGLAATPVPGVAGGVVSGIVPPQFTFDLQIVADGFTAPNGSSAKLEVQRDNFQSARVSVTLIAPDVQHGTPFPSDLEVQFYYEGNLCGRALRTIVVGDGTFAGAPAVTTESMASVSISTTAPPDLTVMISRGVDESRLSWTFTAGTGAPSDPVYHQLEKDSAKSFALDLVRNLSHWDKSSLAPAQLLGVAEQISGAMPNEFWLELDEIWARKQAAGGAAPSILLVSEDPYIPWELAATTGNYARPERLDPAKPPFLGAQTRMGRWIPPDPTPFGGDIPPLPPVTTAQVDQMVLFIGDYEAINGQRPLPLAIEEGNRLAVLYDAVRRQAVLKDVTDLIRDEIVEGGQAVKVDAVHFACHGETSTNPRFNGIVLSDRNLRLGPEMIFGSRIGTTSNPFVFVNACQLGLATEGLDGDYGGLAGAFLDQGATGFVSPLWNVDDDIAQEFALDFYERVYDANDPKPVSVVMSELRSRFDVDSSSPRASYLAYVFYGHPDLIINKV